ncbi:TIGR02302 family protein [Epibacterium sp. Ofav1-8]|uniref:TIGR02302 family protein n=1 Tax=Epibacterium sp. Ofav1-8 TaxID=2917735 RepID=UPI001EF535EF|nr:TIGR02302 family protein [Epibacterium sp. Ofav1-8]MCG7621988.1 TIGR02302 family protein [Epibacterium sp. Ofav1-8]
MTEQHTPDPSVEVGSSPRPPALAPLRRAIVMTRLGLVAERLWRAFWPLVTILFLATGIVLLGGFDWLAVEAVWALVVITLLGSAAALVWGALRFRWPRDEDALIRLDQTLPGRPIAALLDTQASGATDPASIALWQAHQDRMAARAARAEAPAPNLRLHDRDPYALRYVALLVLVTGVLFGTAWRAGSVAELLPGTGTAGLSGPTWEGWIEPPRYTGLPTLYLGDMTGTELRIPENSQITLRFYGEVGDLALAETVSGRTGELPSATDPEQSFAVTRSGDLTIDGPGGDSWQVSVIADAPPDVAITGTPDLAADGTMTLPFDAADDYGVIGGQVTITLDDTALPRTHGLATPPDARDPITVPLPLSLTGDRRMFSEALVEDFSAHPWANLPVVYSFRSEDAPGQQSRAATLSAPLTARRFFDPMAAALIEQRRDLLWARANGPRVAQILRTLSHRPEDVFPDMGNYLQLRTILKRLESFGAQGPISVAQQEEIATALWDLALQLEEGDVGDALERMRQAQERLSQAMRDGASDEEIARLMQELREATEDYMRQLSRQAQEQGDSQDGGEEGQQNSMQLSQSDLQAMMDRIQELMEQGRMAEAEQALREFQQMMENMRVTQGEGGEGGSPGQEAMEGLAETLRDQQGLSDQAFRDLQEQFNPDARRGESQGNEGRNGGLGRGQSHEGGQGGQGGSDGQSPGERDQSEGGQGQGGSSAPGATPGSPEDLAQRQQALRNELQRQRDGLPLGGPEGDAARDSLDQAGRAMEGAEEALRGGDYAEAIDRQSEAMEALREGMRALGEAMAEQQQQGQQPGNQQGLGNRQGNALDPLGRDRSGQGGDMFSRDSISDGQAYRRAWDLLEEIRRRAGERERSESERNYLQRLLDKF